MRKGRMDRGLLNPSASVPPASVLRRQQQQLKRQGPMGRGEQVKEQQQGKAVGRQRRRRRRHSPHPGWLSAEPGVRLQVGSGRSLSAVMGRMKVKHPRRIPAPAVTAAPALGTAATAPTATLAAVGEPSVGVAGGGVGGRVAAGQQPQAKVVGRVRVGREGGAGGGEGVARVLQQLLLQRRVSNRRSS
jgi:hypothetical protein